MEFSEEEPRRLQGIGHSIPQDWKSGETFPENSPQKGIP